MRSMGWANGSLHRMPRVRPACFLDSRGEAPVSSFGGASFMKLCSYCGRENEDHAVYCRECGTSEFKTCSDEARDETQTGEAAERLDSELEPSDIATTCEWCGRENVGGAVNCQECGTSLRRPRAKADTRSKVPERKPIRWNFRTLTADEMELDLVTLVSCQSIVEADVVVGQLESIGITAFIPDEFVAQAMAWNVNAFGYVRVQVYPKDYERAKTFLLELSEIAEPGATPNGGFATPPSNSGAKEGPPSES